MSVGAHAETDELRAEASRTYQSIEIDGELSESDWQKATPIRQFTQFEPDAGEPMTQPTEVRILYDDRHIYFGFVCSEPERSKIVANKMRRDTMLWDQDNVFVLLDTYNDRRSGFFFRVNPIGAREDIALMDSGDSRNENWNAVWDSQAKINGDNWTTEIAIPFSQLRFKDEETSTWGLNLGRTIPEKPRGRHLVTRASRLHVPGTLPDNAPWDPHRFIRDFTTSEHRVSAVSPPRGRSDRGGRHSGCARLRGRYESERHF